METTQRSIYEQVIERIIALLEQGIIPWLTSWKHEPPMNLISHRPYRAVNILLLASHEYDRNYFLTERQIQRLGGSTKQGEKPHLVVDGIGTSYLKPYYVWNVAQIEHLSKNVIPPPFPRSKPIAVCKEVIEYMYHCPRIRYGEHTHSFYFLRTDTIYMPNRKRFTTAEEYYSSFFTGLVSATKHELRVDRIELHEFAKFDPSAFAREQLIVEIGAWLLRCFCGLKVKLPNYTQGDVHRLSEFLRLDYTLAFNVCLKAQEAFEWIIGMPFDTTMALDFVEDERLPF